MVNSFYQIIDLDYSITSFNHYYRYQLINSIHRLIDLTMVISFYQSIDLAHSITSFSYYHRHIDIHPLIPRIEIKY